MNQGRIKPVSYKTAGDCKLKAPGGWDVEYIDNICGCGVRIKSDPRFDYHIDQLIKITHLKLGITLPYRPNRRYCLSQEA